MFDETLFQDPISDPETDYHPYEIENCDDSLAYGLYCKLRSYSHHYHNVKLRLKLLSITWFLAAFIGMGYILSGQEAGLPVTSLVSIIILAFLGACGILLLSFLDIAVYHRLVEAILLSAIAYEQKYTFLTSALQSAGKLLLTKKKKIGPVIYDGIFYAYLCFLLLLIGDIALFFAISSSAPLTAIIVCFIILLAIIAVSLFTIISSTKTSMELFKNADFYIKHEKSKS